MTKINIQCSLVSSGRMMALQAQGRHEVHNVVGSGTSWGWWHHRLGEDDGVVGLGIAWVDGVAGSWMAQHHGLREHDIVVGSGMASRAWGRHLRGWRHHWLMSGKMAARKRASTMVGNDGAEAPGRTQRWLGGSGWDSMMAWAPGRSTMARAPGKLSAGNFGRLTVWVKPSGN
jgi:hypothetical protein